MKARRFLSRIPTAVLFISGPLLVATLLAACGGSEERPMATDLSPVMVINLTSGADEDLHSVTMAMQLAGHALDDGREVVLFFNVRAVRIPTKTLRTNHIAIKATIGDKSSIPSCRGSFRNGKRIGSVT